MGELFHRTDYYRTALRLLGKTAFERRMMVDISTEPAWEKKGGRRLASRYHDDPELRYALEDTLRTQQVRAVVLDEAQHLMQGGKAATPLDQPRLAQEYDQRDWGAPRLTGDLQPGAFL